MAPPASAAAEARSWYVTVSSGMPTRVGSEGWLCTSSVMRDA